MEIRERLYIIFLIISSLSTKSKHSAVSVSDRSGDAIVLNGKIVDIADQNDGNDIVCFNDENTFE